MEPRRVPLVDARPEPATGPLAGMRVVEVASFVAAPLAGMTLHQLGAEVIRVDPVGGGADADRWPLHHASGASMYWAGLNKGKQSLLADLRAPEGQQLVGRLLEACPAGTAVLVTNTSGREWLSYEHLVRLRPDLIHVEVRGKPDGTPAVDYTVNAGVGFPLVTGQDQTTEPVNHVLPAWDIACGLYTALAVAAADRQRAESGEGARLTISLADVALASAGNLGFLAEAELNDADRPRIGNHLFGSFARDFTCGDGRSVMVVALTTRHWRDLVRLTGAGAAVEALESGLGVDFAEEGIRYTYREALAALIAPWFRERSSAEVESALGTTSILWEPYRSFREVADGLRRQPHPLMELIDQPGLGRYHAPRSPIDGSAWNRSPEPSPVLGADTRRLLAERLGMTNDDIARLLEAGVVADSRTARRGA